jgi:hypothetical protein
LVPVRTLWPMVWQLQECMQKKEIVSQDRKQERPGRPGSSFYNIPSLVVTKILEQILNPFWGHASDLHKEPSLGPNPYKFHSTSQYCQPWDQVSHTWTFGGHIQTFPITSGSAVLQSPD